MNFECSFVQIFPLCRLKMVLLDGRRNKALTVPLMKLLFIPSRLTVLHAGFME